MGVFDLLFGAGPLKKAAAVGDPPKPTGPAAQPATLDIAGMAQKDADKAAAAKKKKAKPALVDTMQKVMAGSGDE